MKIHLQQVSKGRNFHSNVFHWRTNWYYGAVLRLRLHKVEYNEAGGSVGRVRGRTNCVGGMRGRADPGQFDLPQNLRFCHAYHLHLQIAQDGISLAGNYRLLFFPWWRDEWERDVVVGDVEFLSIPPQLLRSDRFVPVLRRPAVQPSVLSDGRPGEEQPVLNFQRLWLVENRM